MSCSCKHSTPTNELPQKTEKKQNYREDLEYEGRAALTENIFHFLVLSQKTTVLGQGGKHALSLRVILGKRPATTGSQDTGLCFAEVRVDCKLGVVCGDSRRAWKPPPPQIESVYREEWKHFMNESFQRKEILFLCNETTATPQHTNRAVEHRLTHRFCTELAVGSDASS